MKISFFQVLGMVGNLAQELTRAAEDGKVDVIDGIRIGSAVASQLGLEWNDKLTPIFDKMLETTQDGKLTIQEVLEVGVEIAKAFDINIETEGIDVGDLQIPVSK